MRGGVPAGIIIGVMFSLSGAASARDTELRINILPMDCVFEVINDGTQEIIYLTPDECGVLIEDDEDEEGGQPPLPPVQEGSSEELDQSDQLLDFLRPIAPSPQQPFGGQLQPERGPDDSDETVMLDPLTPIEIPDRPHVVDSDIDRAPWQVVALLVLIGGIIFFILFVKWHKEDDTQ